MATALLVPVLVVGILVGAILPTGLYWYVEPRGRLSWGSVDDTPRTRRAPIIVRASAWLSFAIGQFALPWLAVPVACGALLYLQAKLGVGRALGVPATVALAGIALAQSALAIRMLPLGVRLLMRDKRLAGRAASFAKWNGVAHGTLLGLGATLSLGMAAAPGLVHPVLRTALTWAAVRPVVVYAALGVLHAVLVGQCARALAGAHRGESAQGKDKGER